MDLISLTLIHTGLSFIALGLGLAAVAALFNPAPRLITNLFLASAWATTLTGFLFPISSPTPALITGFVSVAVLAVTAISKHFGWNRIRATGIVISAYLLVFVTIAQAFLKLPPLQHLAPTGSEPPFAAAQLFNLALFAYVGYRAWRAQPRRQTAARPAAKRKTA